MPKLMVVFEYPNSESLEEARRVFANGGIDNLVECEIVDEPETPKIIMPDA